ncbi:MAG TPA: N-acetyltransferase, partial [Thermoclostridium sp.]|nr:N-acetyltransferase [Thermoclostridium sp.]
MSFFVHESSYVDENVSIGKGTKIWHFCHVQEGAVIGDNCSLGQNVNISNNVKIGKGVKIQNNVSVYEGVELEDYVFCGPSMVFTNDLTPRSKYSKGPEQYKKT